MLRCLLYFCFDTTLYLKRGSLAVSLSGFCMIRLRRNSGYLIICTILLSMLVEPSTIYILFIYKYHKPQLTYFYSSATLLNRYSFSTLYSSIIHSLFELSPNLSCWILWRSLRRWSCIFQRPCPNITAEYIPWVIMGARILSVCQICINR